MLYSHLGKHLNILHKCPYCEKTFGLEGLMKHYMGSKGKKRCTGRPIIQSKEIYEENKVVVEIINGPRTFLDFYKTFDIGPFLKPKRAAYSCNMKFCRYHVAINGSSFKKHLFDKHMGIELKCYAC